MASTVPPVPNYVYIAIRLKLMSEEPNGLVRSGLFGNCEETNGVFLIGGLVQARETLMTNVIHHCRHLFYFRVTLIDRLYMAKILNGFMDRDPIKISVFYILIFVFEYVSMCCKSVLSRSVFGEH